VRYARNRHGLRSNDRESYVEGYETGHEEERENRATDDPEPSQSYHVQRDMEDYRAGYRRGAEDSSDRTFLASADERYEAHVRTRGGGMRENPRGSYSDGPFSEDDYVLRRHGLSGQVYVDRVGRGGMHTTIGGTRGFATVEDAIDALVHDGHVQDISTSVVFNDEGLQLGNVIRGRFEGGGDDTIENVERFVRNPSASDRRAYDFFRQQAGGVVGRNAEGAWQLVKAEKEAEERGWTVEWEPEQDPDTSWMNDEELKEARSGGIEILSALLRDENGEVLASLGEIAILRGDQKYPRVVEAELALEALSEMGVKI
jgi:hypothetical protein